MDHLEKQAIKEAARQAKEGKAAERLRVREAKAAEKVAKAQERQAKKAAREQAKAEKAKAVADRKAERLRVREEKAAAKEQARVVRLAKKSEREQLKAEKAKAVADRKATRRAATLAKVAERKAKIQSQYLDVISIKPATPATPATSAKKATRTKKSKPEPVVKPDKRLRFNEFVLFSKAGDQLKEYRMAGLTHNTSYQDCISAARPKIETVLESNIMPKGIKFNVIIHCQMERATHVVESSASDALGDDDTKESNTTLVTSVITEVAFLRSKPKTSLNVHEIQSRLDSALEECESQLDAYTHGASGWKFVKVLRIDLEIAVYAPLKGASYIPTPDFVPARSIVNIKNEDNKCFMYSVMAAIFPPTSKSGIKHSDRPSIYKEHMDKLTGPFPPVNFDGITYPVTEAYYSKFEANNPGLSLNVYATDKKDFYAVYVSKKVGRKNIDLLILQELVEPAEEVKEAEPAKKSYFNRKKFVPESADPEPAEEMYDPVQKPAVTDPDDGLVSYEDAEELDDQPEPPKKTAEIKQHYVWIKDLGTMLCRLTKHEHKRHPCRRCLHIFRDKNTLDRHIPDCNGISEAAQRIVMPGKNEIIKFNDYQKQLRAPYIIYSDFECLNRSVDPNSPEARTGQLTKQEAYSYYYVVVRSDGVVVKKSEVYTGDEAAVHFLKKMQEEEEEINDLLRNPVAMVISDEDEHKFRTEVQDCCICGKEIVEVATGAAQELLSNHPESEVDEGVAGVAEDDFDPEGNYDPPEDEPAEPESAKKSKKSNHKVRHHDHITGKYIGPAHNNCNLRLRLIPGRTKIPVVFRNLKNYDSKLIITSAGKLLNLNMTCIANNMEKYLTVGIGQLQFIDSYQFMAASLDTLAANLPDSQKRITRELTPVDLFDLVTKKGVFPYEYINSFKRLDEPRLPPQRAFFSKLLRKELSTAEYLRAQLIWRTAGCKTLGDYSDVYIQADVHLLADVFENFRDTSIKHYGLDPANFYTAPGLSWSSMLKMTKVNLEPIRDINIHLLIERGLRGGISTVCAKRYSGAKIEMLPDGTEERTQIMYLDANNLYGHAMCQPLPHSGFEWYDLNAIAGRELTSEERVAMVEKLIAERPEGTGYLFETKLHYPKELHDLHNSYPLAPEAKVITLDRMSKYQKKLVSKLNLKPESMKLLTTLDDKDKYVVHHQTLKLYLELGLKLTDVYRIVKFNESPWLKPYIEFNTELRKKAANAFEKDFFKLMNNSVFGKTMENLRNRIKVHLLSSDDESRITKLVSSPQYLSHKIFDGGVVAINSRITKLKLNKPVYAGQAILDLSKNVMYNFWYGHIMPLYGSKAQLIYTDTDSLLFEVKTKTTEPDVYDNMKKYSHLYDLSEYRKDHPLYDPSGAKVPGRMKDETNGTPITRVVAIRSKAYAVDYEAKVIKKDKGVSRTVVEQDLTFDMYADCINNGTVSKHNQTAIRSFNHKLGLYEYEKISLSPLDTKRWYQDDGINSLAYGHYKIKELQAAEVAVEARVE